MQNELDENDKTISEMCSTGQNSTALHEFQTIGILTGVDYTKHCDWSIDWLGWSRLTDLVWVRRCNV